MFVAQDHGFQTTHRRKCELKGERSPTVCFEGQLLGQPYTHLLNCGHAIKTRTIEKCGSNCMQSKTFDCKPRGSQFECGKTACANATKRMQAAFIPKKPKTRSAAVMKPRKGTETHVYGLNPEADKRYQAKEQEDAMDQLGGMGMTDSGRRGRGRTPGPQTRARKRSASLLNVRTRSYRDREPLRPQAEEDAAQRRLLAETSKTPFLTSIANLQSEKTSTLQGKEASNLQMNVKPGIFSSSATPRRPLQRNRGDQDLAMEEAPTDSRPKELRNLDTAGRPALGYNQAMQQVRRPRPTMQYPG